MPDIVSAAGGDKGRDNMEKGIASKRLCSVPDCGRKHLRGYHPSDCLARLREQQNRKGENKK